MAATAIGACANWAIVVTGHSLGAGIAAFVAMHLHRLAAPVHSWCYSSPGWLMTPELAESATRLVTSVVINKDIFPRCPALLLILRLIAHLTV